MKTKSSLLQIVYTRRELIGEMTRRELRDRHAGQTLGAIWAFSHPLLLMLIYTVLFSYVFPTRFVQSGVALDFSVNVFAGIVPWLAFQDLLSRSPSILVSHANLVKQIVFPTQVLPVKTTIASILPYVFGMLFSVCYAGWHGKLTLLSLALPLLVLCQWVAMTGVAFLLSAVGVFFRDLREFITLFCSINLFAQPILYNPFATPRWLNWVFAANPFSYLVWCWQDALFWGKITHPIAWVALPIFSAVMLLTGWLFFERTRHMFGEAL